MSFTMALLLKTCLTFLITPPSCLSPADNALALTGAPLMLLPLHHSVPLLTQPLWGGCRLMGGWRALWESHQLSATLKSFAQYRLGLNRRLYGPARLFPRFVERRIMVCPTAPRSVPTCLPQPQNTWNSKRPSSRKLLPHRRSSCPSLLPSPAFSPSSVIPLARPFRPCDL